MPQLVGSVCMLTQSPLQVVKLGSHLHAELTQVELDAQAVLHAPQLFESVTRSTHAPLQLVKPVWQVVVQTPMLHTWPEVQA